MRHVLELQNDRIVPIENPRRSANFSARRSFPFRRKG